MNKRNLHKTAAISVVIFILFIIALILVDMFAKKDMGRTKTLVYFLNPSSNELEPEIYYLNSTENNQIAQEVLAKLVEGPKSSTLIKTFPDYVKFLDGRLVIKDNSPNASLEVEFSQEYNKMTPPEEQFFRASLVFSMTELPFVNDVLLYVDGHELLRTDGNPVGYMSRDNFVINPVISPEKVISQRFTLYFYNSSAKKLEAEQRQVLVNPNQPIAKYILEQLIAGPKKEGLSPTVPPETKILGDVKTEDGTCYINLSNDYMSRNNALGELLLTNIFSVVNSITELEDVNKVQFLIEGEKIDNFKNVVDLSMPVLRNRDYILKE